jgi:hypothetical protein
MSVGIVREGTATGKQLFTLTEVGKPCLYDIPEGIKPWVNIVKPFLQRLNLMPRYKKDRKKTDSATGYID